ncbi:hypothetical protein V5N11_001817 [Cardamine amara subsp. amara]|uniref:Reverse transcriptase n=1 Tax=Cardamine amara subsp. amara TaxID=228776 RepID=A0ABD1BL73_CARAN
MLTNLEDIKRGAVLNYQNFLQTHPQDDVEVSVDFLSSLLHYRSSEQSAVALVAPVTASEIQKVLFSMPTNKTPGQDGFTVEFYKVAWLIVSHTVFFPIWFPTKKDSCNCLIFGTKT